MADGPNSGMPQKLIVCPCARCAQSSLADLNTRLPQQLPMNRFRPNIVIDASVAPWAEDDWQEFAISGGPERAVEFVSLKPCSRCKARPRACARPGRADQAGHHGLCDSGDAALSSPWDDPRLRCDRADAAYSTSSSSYHDACPHGDPGPGCPGS
jgi:hypothetical protein